ncbi:YCF48-related protein [Schleiferia thermophila]|uniref:WD40/YVTN/BNR-like repeat-containing protein n=1 Tax=Schleiferia thermophila TaxID=884107 RepID=UPI003EEBB05C
MKQALSFILLIYSLHSLSQVSNETTPTTQGLWGAAESGIGQLFMVGNNGTIIRRNAGCVAQWSSITAPTTSGLRAITFTGDSIGIIVGVSGTLLRSTNHGSSWSTVFSGTTAGLLDVIADDSIVIAVGGGAASGNVVIRSGDYGQTWTTVVSTLPASSFSIAKVTDNTFVLCGVQGTVFRSTDKGLTWTAVTGPFAGTLSSVDFFDHANGMICGQNGAVYKTKDGGLTWSQVNYNSSAFFNGGLVLKPWRYLLVGNSGVALQADSSGTSHSVGLSTTQAMRVIIRYRDRIYIAGNQGLVFTVPFDGDFPTIFQENFCSFTDSIQPPSGWSNQSPLPNRLWRFDNPFPTTSAAASLFVPPFAVYQPGFYGPGQDSAILTTPPFNTTGALFPLVQWNEFVQPPLSGTMTMRIQAFNGSQWSTIYESNGFFDGAAPTALAASPRLKNTARRAAVLPLPNMTGVQLRFIISSSNSTGGFWLIDDIRVTNSSYDVQLDSVIHHTGCSPVNSDLPQAVVFNNSQIDHFPILTTLWTNSGTIQRTISEVAPPFSDYAVNLVPSPIPVSNGDSLYAQINAWDQSATNHAASFIYSFMQAVPGTNGARYTLCGPDTLTVSVSAPAGITVQWTFGGTLLSTQPLVHISQPGVYYVTFQEGNCSVTDSVVVNLVPQPTNPLASLPDTINPPTPVLIPIGNADSMLVMINHSSLGQIANVITTSDFTFTPGATGSVAIQITLFVDSCDFTYSKTLTVVSGIGISEIGDLRFSIFPNPSSDWISIKGMDAVFRINVYNLPGHKVLSVTDPSDKISIGHLTAGPYIVEIIDRSGRVGKVKFLKK